MEKELIKTLDFSKLTKEEKNDYLTNIWLKDEMNKIYEYCEGDRKKMQEILYLMPFHPNLHTKIEKLIFDFKDLKESPMKSSAELQNLLGNLNNLLEKTKNKQQNKLNQEQSSL